MIHLTETAASAMRDAISSAGVQGLRLGVQPGGCAGMKISMGLVKTAQPDDIVVEQHGVLLFVQPAHEAQAERPDGGFRHRCRRRGLHFRQSECPALRLRQVVLLNPTASVREPTHASGPSHPTRVPRQ